MTIKANKKVLVTGGSGYIGSHTCLELLEAGYEIVVVDNLCNSSIESLKRVEILCDCEIPFYKADVSDKEALQRVFEEHSIDTVMHFAALKAVGASLEKPIQYYTNNINGTLVLLDVMSQFNCFKLVFSSSATVYGNPNSLPIDENFPLSATNPYGRSKLIIEDILKDLFASNKNWKISILRYFNPIGAHKSGIIGEDSKGIPNNIMPYIAQVAIGTLPVLNVFGDDYDTPDGTCLRDYIHVSDLAMGHVKALQAIAEGNEILILNLGTGKGYSVLELVRAFEKVSERKIPIKIVSRRLGDVFACYADARYAEEKLGWKAQYSLRDMCEDTWRWQLKNPQGFARNISNY